MKIKVHLGCGKRNFGEDWTHIDIANFDHIKFHNIFDFPLINVDLIYASHLINYFNYEEAVKLLEYLYKKLKIGGVLRLALPDFEKMCDLYHSKKFPLSSFLGPLYGRMNVNGHHIYHKYAYDIYSISDILKNIGYKNIKKWDHNKVDHGIFDDHSQAYLPKLDKDNGTLISLNIECNK